MKAPPSTSPARAEEAAVSGQPDPAVPDRAQGLRRIILAFIFLTFFRLHDFFPALAVIRPLQLLTLGVFLLWLADRSRQGGADPIMRWQLVLLGVMLLGLPVVVNHYYWLQTVVDYLMYLIVFSLGLALIARNPSHRWAVMRLLAIALIFLSLWAFLNEGVGPSGSWLEDENDLAAALVVGICLGYAIWAESPARLTAWFGLATALLCIVGIVATSSRGGFLAMASAIVAIGFYSGRLLRTVATVMLLVLLSLPVVPPQYLDEIRSITTEAGGDSSTYGTGAERLYTWRRTWEMFLANPIIGVGAGNAPWTIYLYETSEKAQLERGEQRMVAGRAVHSVYFTLLPEMGLAGAVAFFAILSLALRRAGRVSRPAGQEREAGSPRMTALFIGPALVGYSVAGVFVSVLWYPMFWILFALAISLPVEQPPPAGGVSR